jgi:hypothetical protein
MTLCESQGTSNLLVMTNVSAVNLRDEAQAQSDPDR